MAKNKKSPIMPDDVVYWPDINKYLRGNPWLKDPTPEMLVDDGIYEPFRYGQLKIIVRYDAAYVYQWFLNYLKRFEVSQARTVLDQLDLNLNDRDDSEPKENQVSFTTWSELLYDQDGTPLVSQDDVDIDPPESDYEN